MKWRGRVPCASQFALSNCPIFGSKHINPTDYRGILTHRQLGINDAAWWLMPLSQLCLPPVHIAIGYLTRFQPHHVINLTISNIFEALRHLATPCRNTCSESHALPYINSAKKETKKRKILNISISRSKKVSAGLRLPLVFIISESLP